MIPLPNEIMAQVSSLQWLSSSEIKARFADLLTDAQKCEKEEALKLAVIYRLQERFYKMSISEDTQESIDRAVSGDRLKHAPADDVGKAAKKLVRNYKGVDYTVLLMHDGSCEYEGRKYKSLTSAAKAITGTHWNGPAFFGVKP